MYNTPSLFIARTYILQPGSCRAGEGASGLKTEHPEPRVDAQITIPR